MQGFKLLHADPCKVRVRTGDDKLEGKLLVSVKDEVLIAKVPASGEDLAIPAGIDDPGPKHERSSGNATPLSEEANCTSWQADTEASGYHSWSRWEDDVFLGSKVAV